MGFIEAGIYHHRGESNLPGVTAIAVGTLPQPASPRDCGGN